MFCREQAVQVHRAGDHIREKGADLAFVGNGGRPYAQAFREQFGITEPVYVDTKRHSYRALSFERGLLHLVGARSAAHAWRALRGGFRQGITRGDALQLGGVVVVRPDGTMPYRYASAVPGDHPPVDEVLRAL